MNATPPHWLQNILSQLGMTFSEYQDNEAQLRDNAISEAVRLLEARHDPQFDIHYQRIMQISESYSYEDIAQARGVPPEKLTSLINFLHGEITKGLSTALVGQHKDRDKAIAIIGKATKQSK